MVIPPCFADLGKKSREVFSKGYNYGQTKLTVKTKTSNDVAFTLNGSNNQETGKTEGSLETKMVVPKYGVEFKEVWSTDNKLTGELAIEDKLINGLKLTFHTAFFPNTGKKNAMIKGAYKREHVHVNVDTDFDFAGPTVLGAAVFGYSNFLAGVQCGFDTSKSALTKHCFAFGYSAQDFVVHTAVCDAKEFLGSVHHQVGDKLEVAVDLGWRTGDQCTRFGIASKYTVDSDSTFHAKVNNSYLIGLGYTQKVRDGVKLTLSGMFDGKNFSAGGHKLGVGLEFDATH